MIVVTFALRQESPATLGEGAIICHTGVGLASVRQRLPARLDALPAPDFLIASGFAGALDPALSVGEIVTDTVSSAPALLRRAQDAGARACLFAHSDTIAETAAAKARLAQSTGAQVVEMETRAIAEICVARGIPLLSVRVISDAATRDFPVPAPVLFDAVRQSPRPLALLAYLATHPAKIVGFVGFLREIRLARKNLANYLQRLLGPQ